VSTIPSISSKRTNHLSPKTIDHKQNTVYGVRNPSHSVGQTQRCGSVKINDSECCILIQSAIFSDDWHNFVKNIGTSLDYFIEIVFLVAGGLVFFY
jgi:hypothetical protein